MAGHRKLGRTPDIRLSILRGLATDLILKGQIETTRTRAKEVRRIAERLITLAAKEVDNYTTREVLKSAAKLDSKGHKLLTSRTSRNDKEYDVVERELRTEIVQVDNPSRLAARRQAMRWLVRARDSEGRQLNPVNHLFNEVAPRYTGQEGGYTRMIPLGPRRGDGAPMVRIELV